MFSLFGDVGQTFKPPRRHIPGSRRFELHKASQATLGTGNLREAVRLPPGEDESEWLAVKTFELFEDVEAVYSAVSEYCTEGACPKMCAGRCEYRWQNEGEAPKVVSAPLYMQLLFAWTRCKLDNDAIFPTEPGAPFPPNFIASVRDIFRRLFRVYAHLYASHFERMQQLGFEPHINTCFKHFMYFVQEFSLIKEDQLLPLRELIDRLMAADRLKLEREQAKLEQAAAAVVEEVAT